jgi:very-short-patch-repair endonuclease
MSGLWFIALLVAAFILWHFVPRVPKAAAEPSPRYRHDPRLTTEQAQWQDFVEEHCESPAEVAFLRAMIGTFAMRPLNSALVADGVRLDFQVQEGRYRTDFLVNQWLVVEIDGAAYHSSPEAIARDQERDHYFEGLGYSVLRIPAKVVFNAPAEAVQRVRAALAVGKRERVVAPPEAEVSGFRRLGRTLGGFSKAVNEINDFVNLRHAVGSALAPTEIAVARERSVFEAMLTVARRKVELDEWLGDDPEKRRMYEEHMARLEALYESKPAEPRVIEPVHLSPPPLTGQAEIDEVINARYAALVAQRQDFLLSTRQTLRSEPAIQPHAEAFLANCGWQETWARVR